MASATDRPQLWSEPALEQLRALQTQSPAVVDEIIELFRADSTRLVGDLRAAMKADDAEAVSRLGHELLGASGTVGAEGMASRAQALKDAFKAGDTARAEALLGELEQVMAQTHQQFSEALRGPG